MVFSFLVQHIDPDLDEVVLPDGGVGEGEDPAGQVPGQGGEAHAGDLESWLLHYYLLFAFDRLTRLIAAHAWSSVI